MVAEAITTYPLVGSMTRMANDVHEHLARVRGRPEIVSVFLDYLHRASWGWAGTQAQQGHKNPGAWCYFSMRDVMEKTGLKDYEIYRARKWLVDMQIISYSVNAANAGFDGRIDWNLSFAEWIPLQPGYVPSKEKWGGARKGAGRPRKEPNGCNLKSSTKRLQLDSSDSQKSLQDQVTPATNVTVLDSHVPALTISKNQDAAESLPKSGKIIEIKMQPPASSEASPDKATEGSAKRQVTKEVETEEITKAPSAPEADASPASSWPERLDHEKSDLDFYQRVIRERESERIALLVRLAHERIGVPLERTSYARMGALAKRKGVGAGLLVEYILVAASKRISGDPLDMLTGIVNGYLRRQEGTNGAHTGTGKRATYNDQAKAGGEDQGTGGNNGSDWAGWNHTHLTQRGKAGAVDQDGRTW